MPEGDDCVDSIQGSCSKSSWQGDGYVALSERCSGLTDLTFTPLFFAVVPSLSSPNVRVYNVSFCDDGNNNAGYVGLTDSYLVIHVELHCLTHDLCVYCSICSSLYQFRCDWDGGDCCGGSTAYCSECECLDCTVDTCSGSCYKNAWKGDGCVTRQ